MRLAIFGRGKVGSALHARASEREGLSSALHSSRGVPPRDRDVELVILAVPDATIEEVAARLDPAFAPSIPFVHCAGTMPAETPLPSQRPTGAMHPIVSFARPVETRVEGRTFTLRGHPDALRRASAFARHLGAIALPIADAGPAYHAASAITANGAVALTHLAVGILKSLDIDEHDGAVAMAGLLRSVADNVESLGVPAALTGPIARGDAQVVAMHRGALDAETRRAYDAVGRLILRAAIDGGLDARAADALARLLEPA
jgi:predicted short-subunit dehydrogenase-like oxidoreductase (DUF2520 family)